MAVPGKGYLAKGGEECKVGCSGRALQQDEALGAPQFLSAVSGLVLHSLVWPPSQCHQPISWSKSITCDSQRGAQDRAQATGRAEGYSDVYAEVQKGEV